MNSYLRPPRRPRIPHAARAAAAVALCLTTAALAVSLAGPALAGSSPASVKGPAHTVGRPLPRPLSKNALHSAAAADDTTAPALTETPSSVPNGTNFTFSYSVPAADLSAANQNWVGVYLPGQTPGVESSTEWQYAPGAGGTLTFSSGALPGVGKYVAYLFYDNGYTELSGPLNFSVTPSKPAPEPRFERSIGHGHLADPFGVAVASDGSLWVADRGTSLIDHFSQNGKFLGSPGSGNGQLDKPQGLAFDSAGDVWVADQVNNRAEEFSAAGSYLAQISVATPWAIAVDPAGNLWVSSPSYADGNAVWELRPGSASNPVEYYGSVQASYGAFSNTAGIALDAQGRIYVAQPDYSFVTVLNSDGSFHTEFGLRQDPSGASENLSFPYGIAVTGNGTVYVADSGNGRIVEYSPAGNASTAAAAATTGVPPPGARFPWWPASLAALLLAAIAGLAFARQRRRTRPAVPAIPAPAIPAVAALPPMTGTSGAAPDAPGSGSNGHGSDNHRGSPASWSAAARCCRGLPR